MKTALIYFKNISVKHNAVNQVMAMVRDDSFVRNAEICAEPRNLPISAEFLCFC